METFPIFLNRKGVLKNFTKTRPRFVLNPYRIAAGVSDKI